MIKINVIGCADGIYISPLDGQAVVGLEFLRRAVNYSAVKLDGANGAIIERHKDGSFKIIQVGGWTYDRGLFCDLY